MSDDRFSHDPTESRDIDPGALMTFDEAEETFDREDADGLGLVVDRHDPLLVVEMVNAINDGRLTEAVGGVISSLGKTYTERIDEDSIRLIYHGQLPGQLHGGDPVTVGLRGEEETLVFRLYDSGWTPITGNLIPVSADGVKEIDQASLEQLLTSMGVDEANS